MDVCFPYIMNVLVKFKKERKREREREKERDVKGKWGKKWEVIQITLTVDESSSRL